MAENKHNWNDRQMEFIIANLLRGGVLLAALFVLIGAVVYLLGHGLEPVNYHVFHGEPVELRSMSGIILEVITFRGRSLIQLGILLLICIPVGRVIVAVFAFYKQRDKLYVAITAIVLFLLMYSLFGNVGNN